MNDKLINRPVKRITSLGFTRAASLWYPIMLTQEAGEITESKAAELLGIGIVEYREEKHKVIRAVIDFIDDLPSSFMSLWEVIKNKPDFFNE